MGKVNKFITGINLTAKQRIIFDEFRSSDYLKEFYKEKAKQLGMSVVNR